jgi:hypothetical protein
MIGFGFKKFLLFALCYALVFAVAAQDCNVNREKDLFTKETRLSSGFIDLSGASVTIDADKKELDILFSFKTNRCFDDGCTATIYFAGTKSKLLLRNAGTMNCEGLYHFIFRNAATVNYQLKKIATAKVSHIVFTDRDQKLVPVNLDEQMQLKFMQAVDCVTKEAVKLLQ